MSTTGNLWSSSFVSCRQMTSGWFAASQASRRGSRTLSELTFQAARIIGRFRRAYRLALSPTAMSGKRVEVDRKGSDDADASASRQWIAIAGAAAGIGGAASPRRNRRRRRRRLVRRRCMRRPTARFPRARWATRCASDAASSTIRRPTSKAYVGNGLTCSNCHLNGGTQAWGGPLIGVWGVFPAYSARSATVETLEDRLNDCFLRSMNGKAVAARQPGNERAARLFVVAVVGRAHGPERRRPRLRARRAAGDAAGSRARQDAVRGQVRRLPRRRWRRDARRRTEPTCFRRCGGPPRSIPAPAWRGS